MISKRTVSLLAAKYEEIDNVKALRRDLGAATPSADPGTPEADRPPRTPYVRLNGATEGPTTVRIPQALLRSTVQTYLDQLDTELAELMERARKELEPPAEPPDEPPADPTQPNP